MTDPAATRVSDPRVRDVLAVLGSALALGVCCGVVWWLLVEPAYFVKTAEGAVMDEAELGERFAADGWYTVIAAVAGVLAGAGLTWWRARNFVLTTVLLVVGAGISATTMALTGRLLGSPDPAAAVAAAEVGDRVPVELEVTAAAGYLVWPIAMLVGALSVLWSQAGDPAD